MGTESTWSGLIAKPSFANLFEYRSDFVKSFPKVFGDLFRVYLQSTCVSFQANYLVVQSNPNVRIF